MSDLISRSELLKHMENAEITQYIDELSAGNDNYNSTTLYDYVKEMPTAYDIEKVIDKLIDESYKIYADDELTVELGRALEIVKSGAID